MTASREYLQDPTECQKYDANGDCVECLNSSQQFYHNSSNKCLTIKMYSDYKAYCKEKND